MPTIREKREKVRAALLAGPHLSDRAIADQCGREGCVVSPPFVGKMRRRLEKEGLPGALVREGLDRRKRLLPKVGGDWRGGLVLLGCAVRYAIDLFGEGYSDEDLREAYEAVAAAAEGGLWEAVAAAAKGELWALSSLTAEEKEARIRAARGHLVRRIAGGQ